MGMQGNKGSTRAARRRQRREIVDLASKIERLQAVYAELPTLQCKGLCHESCGPIVAPLLEWAIASDGRLDLRLKRRLTCPLLTDDKRCSAYEKRPLICRIYGMVDNPLMRCEHGCTPSRWLTDEDVDHLFRRVHAIQGSEHFAGPGEGFLRQLEGAP